MGKFAKQLAESSGVSDRQQYFASRALLPPPARQRPSTGTVTPSSVQHSFVPGFSSTSSARRNGTASRPSHSPSSSITSWQSVASLVQRSKSPTPSVDSSFSLPPGLAPSAAPPFPSRSRFPTARSAGERQRKTRSVATVRWVDEHPLDMESRPVGLPSRPGGMRQKRPSAGEVPDVVIPSRQSSLVRKQPRAHLPQNTRSAFPPSSKHPLPDGLPQSNEASTGHRRPSFGLVKRKPVPPLFQEDGGESGRHLPVSAALTDSSSSSDGSTKELPPVAKPLTSSSATPPSPLRMAREGSVKSQQSSINTMLTALEGQDEDGSGARDEGLGFKSAGVRPPSVALSSDSSSSSEDGDRDDTLTSERTLMPLRTSLARENSHGSIFVENFSRSPTLESEDIGILPLPLSQAAETSSPPSATPSRESSLARVMRKLSLKRDGSAKSRSTTRAVSPVPSTSRSSYHAPVMLPSTSQTAMLTVPYAFESASPLPTRPADLAPSPTIPPSLDAFILGNSSESDTDSFVDVQDELFDLHGQDEVAPGPAHATSPPLVPIPSSPATTSTKHEEQRRTAGTFLSKFPWAHSPDTERSLAAHAIPSPPLSSSSSPSLNITPLSTPQADTLSPMPDPHGHFTPPSIHSSEGVGEDVYDHSPRLHRELPPLPKLSREDSKHSGFSLSNILRPRRPPSIDRVSLASHSSPPLPAKSPLRAPKFNSALNSMMSFSDKLTGSDRDGLSTPLFLGLGRREEEEEEDNYR